jgi:hypothetical protein
LFDAASYLHDRVKAVGPNLLPSVRTLAVPDQWGLELIPAGSAVLIWYRGHRYILSAAHVVELYPDRSYYIGTDTRWVEIDGPFRVPVAPKGGREEDHFDFAFRRLTPAFANDLDGCVFLSADRVAIRDDLRFDPPNRSKYLAVGYPLNRFELLRGSRTTVPKNLSFTGALASKEEYLAAKLDPSSHIVTDFDSKRVGGPDGMQSAPSVEGLSGGGMFRFPSIESKGSVALPRLAAITIEHRAESRLMVGVRIDVILAAIDKDVANEEVT